MVPLFFLEGEKEVSRKFKVTMPTQLPKTTRREGDFTDGISSFSFTIVASAWKTLLCDHLCHLLLHFLQVSVQVSPVSEVVSPIGNNAAHFKHCSLNIISTPFYQDIVRN